MGGQVSLRGVVVAVLLGATTAAAEDAHAQAQQLFKRGVQLYDAQRYPEAIDSFRAGYALEARPEFLFAMAQAQRLSGDCKNAVSAYRAFIRAGATPKQVAAVQAHIDACNSELARAPADGVAQAADAGVTQSEAPAVAEPSTPPAENIVAVHLEPPPRPNRGPLIFGGVGLAAGVAGAALWVSAKLSFDELSRSCAPLCAPEQTASLEPRKLAGIATVAIAGALIITAALWWFLSAAPEAAP
jgi:hypothetical protein